MKWEWFLMVKRIILILSIIVIPLASFAEISKNDEDKLTNCTGIYYAFSMIPQGQLELDKIVHSFAAKKFLSSYLVKEGVNEDNLNKELIKIVDVRYGKPYEESTTKECDSFIYQLIPNSKDEIDKLIKSGIY